jgi:O-antigen/teichoic acid export membrane protein
VQLIGFVGNVLIARQLTPDDYGLVAMLSIFIGIAWNLTESGFADFLIVKADADEKDFSTVFSHNIFVSLLLYAILYFSAPAIATFFNRTELIEITRIIGLSIILKAITLTEFTRMRKELMFKKTALIQFTSSIVSVMVAYVMALNGFGYWAIVFQTIVIALTNLVMIAVMNKWLPKFSFDWNRYMQMRVFSNNMLVSYFSTQIGQNIYSVFIGKFQADSLLGYYNQAVKINDAGSQGINAVILTTSYPILAKEKDREQRKRMYDNVLNHFLFIQFLFCFFIIGAAAPLMEVLFGVKWLQTVPYLQLLTLSLLLYPLSTLNSNIVKIEGKSNLYRNLTFLRNGLNLLAILCTFRYSIEIILVGQIIARFVSVVIDVFLCGGLIDFYPSRQFGIVFLQLAAPVVGMIAAYCAGFYIMQPHLKLSVYLAVYFLVFYGTNKILKNLTQQYYLDKILTFLRKGAR